MGQTEEEEEKEEGDRDGEEEEVIGHFQPFVLSARSFNTQLLDIHTDIHDLDKYI